MKQTLRPQLQARPRRLAAFPTISLFVIAALAVPRPATAQISRLGGTIVLAQALVRGTDVAFNAATGAYLTVGAHLQSAIGVCTNANGTPVSPPFAIGNGVATGTYLAFPRVAGGAGGTFLVTWHEGAAQNGVYARLVSCSPPYNLTAPALVSDFQQLGSFQESGPAVAYSSTSGRFLVVWRTNNYAIHGRFVDQNGNPIGGVFWVTNAGGSRDPGVTWNAATNEFGVSYTGWDGSGALAGFGRINAAGDGSVLGRTTFGYSGGTFNTDIAYNALTGHYVMGWFSLGGSNYATFNHLGTFIGSGLLSSEFGGTDSLSLGFSNASGTFLAVGQHTFGPEVAGAELNTYGVPVSGTAVLTDFGGPGLVPGGFQPGSFYPRVAGHTGLPRWNVGYSRQFGFIVNQIVATTTTGGGPQTPPGGAPPAPPGGGGGGGGGGSCPGSAPFAGAVCVNGGWVSGGGGGGGGGSCPGSAPFAGAVCVNGGWVSGGGGGGGGGSCPGSAPFAGAVCVNGGWVSGGGGGGGGGSCPGSAPFAGAVCVNGGWVPGGGGGGGSCPGSAPFGGAVCVNGGWVPGGGGGRRRFVPRRCAVRWSGLRQRWLGAWRRRWWRRWRFVPRQCAVRWSGLRQRWLGAWRRRWRFVPRQCAVRWSGLRQRRLGPWRWAVPTASGRAPAHAAGSGAKRLHRQSSGTGLGVPVDRRLGSARQSLRALRGNAGSVRRDSRHGRDLHQRRMAALEQWRLATAATRTVVTLI